MAGLAVGGGEPELATEHAGHSDANAWHRAIVIGYGPTGRTLTRLLRDNGIEPTVIEYLKTPPSRAELVKLINDAGIDVRTAIRKREPLYAELNLADADDDGLLDAMAEHPILIERPFVVTPTGTRLARPLDSVREIL